MGNTLVSVILTCYNQEPYLAEALESVLNQTYPYWECIILNDGSTDHSEEVALQYVSKDKRFVYVYQENQGVVSARNHAISASKGTYILPLDGDDKIAPQYLELAVDVLDRSPEIALVYCDVLKFGEESGPMCLSEMTIRNLLRSGCCVSSSMFRRETYHQIGGYKEEMKDGWEDWEFFISLMESGGKVYKLEQPLFFYRILHHSRDRKIEDKDDLKKTLVQLHPVLYYNEYVQLLSDYESVIHSRGYRLLSKVLSFIHKK